MMEGWEKEKLSNVANVFSGYAFKSIDMDSQIGIPLIKIKNINHNKVSKVCDSYLNPKYFTKKQGKYILKKDDFLVAMTGQGSVGRIGKMRGIDKNYLVNQRVGIVRVEENLANAEYIFQFMGRKEIETVYFNLAMGAGQPNLSPKDIGNLEINLPPLPTQCKIAKILSAYDDLIENNLKRIKLLEEMAQTQFNEWYANNKDYNEVNLGSIIGHEIGGGWGAEEQSDEFIKSAYVIRGTDIDELPNGKLEKVPFRFHKKSNLASRKLQDGDIIFEVSGGSSYEGVAKTLLVTDELLKQFDNAVMPASFCKLARPLERKYSSFLFLFWRFLRNIKGTEVFEIRSASNIVNYNWTAFLKFQKINKPSENELNKFNEIVEPIYKQVYNLGNQNQRLKEARDILLPRLMTGMIDVEKLSEQADSEMEDELTMAAEDVVEYGKPKNT